MVSGFSGVVSSFHDSGVWNAKPPEASRCSAGSGGGGNFLGAAPSGEATTARTRARNDAPTRPLNRREGSQAMLAAPHIFRCAESLSELELARKCTPGAKALPELRAAHQDRLQDSRRYRPGLV